jgi:hypothetical chaperone protein
MQTSPIGIDFGTTNSSIARVTPAGVELLRFSNDAQTSRSILYLERSAKGILSISGAAAIERYLAAHAQAEHPGRLIQSLKSWLPSRTLTATEVFGRSYTLEDLISRILRDLRLQAEQHWGMEIREATAGRPVRFVGAETPEDEAYALARLEDAYHRAGFERVRFEFEPLAAARAYAATLKREELILIGDFGGGTSDFSLLRVGPGAGREVLATAGLPFAGDAFDARIVRRLVSPELGSETHARGTQSVPAVPAWIYANLERWHHLSFLRTRNVMELLTAAHKRAEEPERIALLQALIEEDLGYQLHQAVQRTKLALSQHEEADFTFNGLETGTFHYLNPPLKALVRREAFEQWIAPELSQIADAVDQMLELQGLQSSAIDKVFLTGGTSFVPAVRRIFQQRFPGRIEAGNEFTSVAQGLALSAGSGE